jgi:gamma-glutamyl:cysteine ligase YbdK (ATP-grasp superfamily)
MPLNPPSLTLGLEEEYLLVDPRSRDLVAAPLQLRRALAEPRQPR